MSCAVVTLQRNTCHNKPIPGDLKCVLTGTASSTNNLYSPCVQTHPSVAKIAAETLRWWVPSVPTPVGIASWLHSRLKQNKKKHLSSAVLTRVEMSSWSCLKEKHPVMHLCSIHICRHVDMVTHLSETETPGDASMQCSHLSECRHGNTLVWDRNTRWSIHAVFTSVGASSW